MIVLDLVCGLLARYAPLRLAESWDNVGLLVGDRRRSIEAVMTCLTLTPEVVEEAIDGGAGLVVVHHPLPFKPLDRITTDSTSGSMLLRLIGEGVAVYSAHTAFDSAVEGINQSWAERLELHAVEALVPWESPPGESGGAGSESSSAAPVGAEGAGRIGRLESPQSLSELARQAAAAVGADAPRIVGDPQRKLDKIAIACGSGGSFLAAARRRGCQALITGEANFHACLEAKASDIGLVLLGHYHSERFAMEVLAQKLQSELSDLRIWASERESNPIAAVSLKH